MKTLIYSDVHGNLIAFEKILQLEKECEQFICLGDLVNYGPWSNECVDLALSLNNSIILKGNHEEYFTLGRYPGDRSLVKLFFEMTFSLFDRLDKIRDLPLETVIGNLTCTHTIDNQYIYKDTDIMINKDYIVGHSHHQFKKSVGKFTLYNAGSVGQNRKKISEINYAIYDRSNNTVSLKVLEFDPKPLIDKFKTMNYPNQCIEYYLSKL